MLKFHWCTIAVKEGYGELFRIRRKDQMEENDTKLFDWTSSSIVSAPIGTYYSIEGGIIHAGAGAINGEVRVMLFWTWNELGAEEYDRDKQETKLTLIISIARDVWPTLTTDELKTEMIALIFYCFWTCEDGYQKTASDTFTDYPKVQLMIQEFSTFETNTGRRVRGKQTKIKQRIQKSVQKVFARYASNEKLWEMIS